MLAFLLLLFYLQISFKGEKKGCQHSKPVLHLTGAYPKFCRTKQLEELLLSLDECQYTKGLFPFREMT